MNQVANQALQQVKQALANATTHEPAKPTTPDFKAMSIMEAAKWCVERGYNKPADIVSLTGKPVTSVYTALWKMRNPKKTKMYSRRAKKVRKLKIELIKDATKGEAKPTTTQKPKITNGRYDDGMETPFLDAINRTRFNFLDEERQPMHDLVAENRRLKILVAHYESILFKGGK